MTKIIVVPNQIWTELGKIWDVLESGGISSLPPELYKGQFEEDSLTDDELAKVLEDRINVKLNVQNDLILGSSDFLPFGFLNKGLTVGKSVCCLLRQFSDLELDEIIRSAKQDARIRGEAIKWFLDGNSSIDPANDDHKEEFKRQAKNKRVPCATGFLVGKSYLLTNLHVVEKQSELSGLFAAFGYESDLNKATIYSFDLSFWKPAENERLDYVLLKLQQEVDSNKFTPINLSVIDSVQIAPHFSVQDIDTLHKTMKLKDDTWGKLKARGFSGDPVNIIQHPEGRSKEIVIFNNQLITLYKDFLVYTSDTQPGSSGSPLFNEQWELIGIHQAVLLDVEKKLVSGYLGIRISSILKDLENQAISKSDTAIQSFLESLKPKPVTTTAQRVFILAGRDRSSILNNPDHVLLEQSAMLQLQKQIEATLKRLNPAISVITIKASEKDPTNQSYKKILNLSESIQNINEAAESSTTQSISIELLTDAYNRDNVGGISIYYNGRDDNGKDFANSLLENISEKNSNLPIFGVGCYSDLVTKSSGLAFCRRLNMPALVFYAGYLSNPQDSDRIKSLLQTETSSLADGIAAGLLAYLQK